MERFIWTHLGLGDQILTNGLIRSFVKKYPNDRINIFAKHHNWPTVNFMFHDDKRIYVHSVIDDNHINCVWGGSTIKIGFEHVNNYGRVPFDMTFYLQAGIPFSAKYDEWFYLRDRTGDEVELFKELGLHEGEEYIFAHDDASSNIVNKIRLPDKKVIRPIKKLTNNIFDYRYTIEQALEIHCIDSAFLALIDQIPTNRPKYFHLYVREYVPSVYWPIPYLTKEWQILTK